MKHKILLTANFRGQRSPPRVQISEFDTRCSYPGAANVCFYCVKGPFFVTYSTTFNLLYSVWLLCRQCLHVLFLKRKKAMWFGWLVGWLIGWLVVYRMI